MNTCTLPKVFSDRKITTSWLLTLLLLLAGPAAFAQLAGTYTINKNLPTAGTNFASFSAAATALNTAGISASVRFNVLNGPYAEQFVLNSVAGVSATDTIVVDGGASKQTLSYSGIVSQPAAVQLNGTDYVTLQNLTIDASAGATYGIGVHFIGSANNNRVANCVVMGPATATSSTANAGIAASGSVTSAATAGDANTLRIENNVISGGYYGLILTGTSTTARTSGVRITGNELKDFYLYGLDVESTAGARLVANNIHRTNRSTVTTFYGVYLIGSVGTAIERNRIHDNFTGNPASTSIAYGIYFSADDATAGNENDVVNNVIYNFNGAGTEYGIYNTGSDFARYYHNTVSLDNTASAATTLSYGFYQTTQAAGLDFRNNVVSVTRGGTGNRFALYFVTTTSTITSNYNDLSVSTGTNFFTGRYGTTNYATLTDWRGANASAFDQNSIAADPRFASVTNLEPGNVALNGAGTVATIVRVPRDINNVLRVSPPDLGAYEFTPVANDVALVSIDAPATPAVPGANPVRVTIRNGGTATLTSVTLSYTLNGGTPTAPQTFAGLTLAAGATQQLTFAQGVVVPSGSNTLSVTASLPNGQPDGNATNNTLTTTFTQPTPDNDEPCTAIALSSGPLTGSNSGASTTLQPTIITPACSPASLPKDVWFTFTPSGPSTSLTLTGNAAGMVRVFSTPNCASGPFTQVFCAGSGANNTAVGTVSVMGLTAGTRYYVAVSGYGSSDTGGTFTIAATGLVLGRTAQANSTALSVFPNPSATGQLTLQVARPLGAGTVELVNALGQVVQRQPLAAGEQTLGTGKLAAGLYTLRVQAGSEVLTRKVVLQ
ncbi:T9SS type A sorting domain-containing protein [Hymenobacter negativus]|uniref:T9SS type A sorting domain-containing protein n=1 Tax=Hymenobacter negativus TaxID=2795026 RepID=A0ABS3QI16_9BACT|nr:T9SS type A sorting domain-containing protein [Hymenobacter negativus]MBO2010360.1 T9SS type A sorting domain-containing protein [Hymenobacter negativus]